ncbi:molecular chaperone, variant 2 [Sarracenia purpurea var. burkii]
MERFARRGLASLGYSPERALLNQSSSPEPPFNYPDIDFHDVFGGPPRRSSTAETRYGFTETLNSPNSTTQGGDDAALRRNSRSGLNEMPVFGDEIVSRRRYPSHDFFDDIFQEDDSLSSPRRPNNEPFGSSPGSRVLSTARPLPPRTDAFSSSLPAQLQFSLPVSASSNRSPHKNKDPTSNGISYLHTPSPPLSRLSSEAFLEEDDLKNELRPSYRPSPLSHSSKDSSYELESTDTRSNLKKDLKSMEAPSNRSHFHFSIYKWASKGAPLLITVRGGKGTKSKKGVKNERYSSSNGSIEIDNMANGLQTVNSGDSDLLHFLNQSISVKDELLYAEDGKQDVEPCLTVKEADNDDITRKSEEKDTVKKTTVPDSNADVCKNLKKRAEKKVNSKKADVFQVNESHSQDSSKTPERNLGRNRVKGKVKDFVKIFNQEAPSKPKIDIETQIHSSQWKSTGTFGADNERSANTIQTNQKNEVDQKLEKPEKQQAHLKTPASDMSENTLNQKDATASSFESYPDDSKVTDENIEEDLFQENFMIKELSNDQDKPLQAGDGYEDIQFSDAKIRQWSSGKAGNIRSLLSTLQYVLWPGSGWKPVALVDIIEGSAVKRAYQKALLCLHPDKLQQKGAATHQKYIAEKVFDILQLDTPLDTQGTHCVRFKTSGHSEQC